MGSWLVGSCFTRFACFLFLSDDLRCSHLLSRQPLLLTCRLQLQAEPQQGTEAVVGRGMLLVSFFVHCFFVVFSLFFRCLAVVL